MIGVSSDPRARRVTHAPFAASSPMSAPPTLALGGALARLAEPGTAVVAGGTDWYPALGDRPVPSRVVDVTRVAGLGGIEVRADGHVRIGAAATWSDLLAAPLPSAFDALRAAAREIGSVQIQNTATLAGNLCNASPAADGVPALLALDASVELVSAAARRTLPLDAFVLGPRKTARRADELVAAILVPPHAGATVARFAKLGGRRYLVISIAMIALVLEPAADGVTIERARIAVGACSPVARRLPALETSLVGRRLDDPALGELVTPASLDGLAPIDDVRASGAYRLEAVAEMLRRLLARDGTH